MLFWSRLFHHFFIKLSLGKDYRKGAPLKIYENLASFMGRPVQNYEGRLENPVRIAYRVGTNEDALEALNQLLQEPNASQLRALIIGEWADASSVAPQEIVETLINAKAQLNQLQALFLGDITINRSELSWIQQADVSSLLEAFPGLLHFGVRGGEGLRFHKISHLSLRTLIVETAGLSSSTIADIFALSLPDLEHLELWLGGDYYEKKSSVKDLSPLFTNVLFPKLRRLGLRNSIYTDEICDALWGSALLEQLSHLDLSLGTLSDDGAEFLLENPKIAQLSSLSLEHHYLSRKMQEKLTRALVHVSLNLRDQQVEDSYRNGVPQRYCAMME